MRKARSVKEKAEERKRQKEAMEKLREKQNTPKRVPHNKGKKKDNHQMVTCICSYCNKSFEAEYRRWRLVQERALKRGEEPRIYCCRDHYYKHFKEMNKGKDPQRIVNWPCAGCGEMITDTYEKWAKGKKFHNEECQRLYLKKQNEKKKAELKKKEEDGKVDVVYEVPYEPHPAQWEVHRSKARFKVLACLPPGELIPGEYKPIEEIQIGETVFNRDGSLGKVLNTMNREFNGHLIEVNARYILPFKVTPEHPILLSEVIRNDNYDAFKAGRRPKKTVWRINQTKWVEAGDLDKYLALQDKYHKWCLHIPRLKASEEVQECPLRPLKNHLTYDKGSFPITKETAWAMGLYVAEGNSGANGIVQFALGNHELNMISRLVSVFESIGYSPITREVGSVISVQICSTSLSELFSQLFGKGAGNKRIPDEIMMHPDEKIVLSFLRGYFDGDGHLDTKRGQLSAKTNSKVLALQIQMLFARLGYVAALLHGLREETIIIEGRRVNANPYYRVATTSTPAIQALGYYVHSKQVREYAFVRDSVILTPLSNVVKIPYDGKVYNLSTTDETFSINNIICHNCGTRWGKDRSTINEFIMRFVEMLEEDRPDHLVPRVHGWILAPTFPMARQIWRELKHFMPEPLIVSKNEADKTMTTVKDGFIEVKSCDDSGALVGVGLDCLTLTEAARVKHLDEVWAFLRGRLSSPGRGPGGKGGIAFINSTPNINTGQFFRKLWLMGRDREANPEWESFHFPTSTNPYIKPEEIEEARKTLPDRLFRQEFLAEFLEGEGAVFSNIQKCAKGALVEPDPDETYVIGYDPARAVDYSAIVIRDTNGQVVHVERSTGKPWTWQVNRIEALSHKYNHARVIMDRTGLGEALVEALAQRLGDSQVEGVFFTQATKESLVNHLAYLMEQEMITYPDIDYLLDELTDYSYKVSQNGRISYGNPEGHDDVVTALMLAMRDFDTRTQTLPYIGLLLGAKRGSKLA